MLAFTRKCQQAVVVEGFGAAAQMLTVTVLGIRGGRVRLGFEVADEIPAPRVPDPRRPVVPGRRVPQPAFRVVTPPATGPLFGN